MTPQAFASRAERDAILAARKRRGAALWKAADAARDALEPGALHSPAYYEAVSRAIQREPSLTPAWIGWVNAGHALAAAEYDAEATAWEERQAALYAEHGNGCPPFAGCPTCQGLRGTQTFKGLDA